MDQATLPVSRIYKYDAIGPMLRSIGTVEGIWTDPDTGQLEFVGIRTGFGPTLHLAPAHEGEISDATRSVRLPYDLETVSGAPSMGVHDEMTAEQRAAIMRHYGIDRR